MYITLSQMSRRFGIEKKKLWKCEKNTYPLNVYAIVSSSDKKQTTIEWNKFRQVKLKLCPLIYLY